eukprot:5597537-Pyramimonas_sp.AAC.2
MAYPHTPYVMALPVLHAPPPPSVRIHPHTTTPSIFPINRPSMHSPPSDAQRLLGSPCHCGSPRAMTGCCSSPRDGSVAGCGSPRRRPPLGCASAGTALPTPA